MSLLTQAPGWQRVQSVPHRDFMYVPEMEGRHSRPWVAPILRVAPFQRQFLGADT
jgi:hypothetical protein